MAADCVLIAVPPDQKEAFMHAADTYPSSHMWTPMLNRQLLSSDRLRAVFALNLTRAWSLGRVLAVARSQRHDTIASLGFARPGVVEQLGSGHASRWFDRTPGALAEPGDNRWRWAAACSEEIFPPSAASPAAARRLVASRLQEWGCSVRRDDAMLVVSELVTNSIEHSSGGAHVGLAHFDGGAVYIEVTDNAAHRFPIFRRPGQGTHAGRGLRIVAATASWWGITAFVDRKSIWVEIASV